MKWWLDVPAKCMDGHGLKVAKHNQLYKLDVRHELDMGQTPTNVVDRQQWINGMMVVILWRQCLFSNHCRIDVLHQLSGVTSDILGRPRTVIQRLCEMKQLLRRTTHGR